MQLSSCPRCILVSSVIWKCTFHTDCVPDSTQATWLQLGNMRARAVNVAIAYRSTITKHIAYPPDLMTHSSQHASHKQLQTAVATLLSVSSSVWLCRSRRINKYYECTARKRHVELNYLPTYCHTDYVTLYNSTRAINNEVSYILT